MELGEDAVQRGALAHAASAFEHAARLTAAPDQRSVRLLAAGRCALQLGALDRADSLLAAAFEQARDAGVRSDIVHLRGIREMAAGNPLAAYDVLVGEANRIEQNDPRRAAALLLDAATAHMETGSLEDLAETARRAGALFERAGDSRAALAVVLLAEAKIALGRPEGPDLLAAEEPFLASVDPLRGALDLLVMAAICWGWIEEYDRAERLLERIIGIARAATALRALPLPLAAASEIAVRRGRLSQAEALAVEADQLAHETRQHNLRPYTLHCVAHLDALRGRAGQARARLARAREMNLAHGMIANNYHVEAILGHLELSLGRLPEAVTALEAAQTIYERRGGEPGLFRSTPDLIEALVHLREPAPAEALLHEYARLVETTGRSFGLAAVARCEGLLAPEHAIDQPFERALAHHRPDVLPLERARTQLCFGERLRRGRRRVDARECLHSALETFEVLGAASWARRTREELAATDGRLHGEAAAVTPFERLTRQELRVARLVVQGASNRDVAGSLYLSTKTVEAHLRQVFRKLNVRSRAELAALAAKTGLDQP
jgi:DNA-binding CsgD family transcriptional regulator/tetratricopeptide (TPR) repeat protein